MRRALLLGGLVAVGIGVGAGTVAASGALGEEDPVEVITVREDGGGPAELTVEDGIARADAERLVRAATAEVPGTALSVERDDGRFEVEVRAPAGRHHEVLLDDALRVVGTDDD